MGYFLTAVVLVLVAGAAFLVFDGWEAFGRMSEGQRLANMQASPRWQGGQFRNALPLKNNMPRAIRDSLKSGDHKEPSSPVAVQYNDGSVYSRPPVNRLRVTWLGHSTVLVELDEAKLLIDPVFGERISPFRWLGPKRWYQSPLALESLPEIDAVLISHDHYDHLDKPSIERLAGRVGRFIVPLGVGSHLEYWGVPADRIEEVDWWGSLTVNGVEVIATPARHASGRQVLDIDKTLWCGFAMVGSKRVYYSGDTGMFPGFKQIGDNFGPFDLAMIEVGAYSRNWPDWHLGPEQAVIANQWVKGRTLLPLHWGLFNLALHNWTEPVERVIAASEEFNLPVVTPRPGQPYEPGVSGYEKWWPDLPFQGPEEHAVLSNLLTDLEVHEKALITGQAADE